LTATGSPATTPAATFDSYIHEGDWHWALNSTIPDGIDALEIVSATGPKSAPVYVEAIQLIPVLNTTDASGMQMLNGSFMDPKQISPKVAASVYELAGHVCMGHIYLRANTTDGQTLLAPISYDEAQTLEYEGVSMTCDEAASQESQEEPDTSSMGSMEGMPMGPMSAPPAPAASNAVSNSVLSVLLVAVAFVVLV